MASATKSMTQGLRMLGGANVSSYTLYFLNPTKKYQSGKHETIVVPYAELGRASSCVIEYGEDASTVSRKHAAIEMQGDNFVIKNLSSTNPTLVNGQPVKDQWFLKNGDEIQLSYEGPKLRFNTNETKTSTMGFTRRMQMFAGQTLKPYKYAVMTISVLLIAVTAGSGYFLWEGSQERIALKKEYEDFATKSKTYTAYQDSLINAMGDGLAAADERVKKAARKGRALESKIANIERKNQQERQRLIEKMKEIKSTGDNAANFISDDDIYFIQTESIIIRLPDGSAAPMEMGWTCTGFLCDDGKFMTARHCIQGWRFPGDETSMIMNKAELDGAIIDVKFVAISPSGKQLRFTYKESVFDDSKDQFYQKNGVKICRVMSTDWAYVQTSERGGIKFDKQLSRKLPAGEKLYFKGYSLGGRFQTDGQIRPLYSESNVAQNGLVQGMINITNRSFESGNSGGPAFVNKGDGTYVAVGIVSNTPINGHTETNIGACVPIGNLK